MNEADLEIEWLKGERERLRREAKACTAKIRALEQAKKTKRKKEHLTKPVYAALLNLRAEGLSYQRIGEAYGKTPEWARQKVNKGIRMVRYYQTHEEASELRTLLTPEAIEFATNLFLPPPPSS